MSDQRKGAISEGRPVVIEYECYSGVMAHITPLNIPTLKAIQLRAKDVLPYPDERPYQHEEENAFEPGQLSPASENPDYRAACKAVDHERALWADRAIFNHCVTFPAYPTRETLIAAFKPKLDKLREIAEIPEEDYEAILFHIILLWNQPGVNEEGNFFVRASEYNRLIQLAIQAVALTPSEVTAGIRFFRPVLQ